MRYNFIVILLSFLFSGLFAKQFTSNGKNILFEIQEFELESKSGYHKAIKDNQGTDSEIGMPELPAYKVLYLVDTSKEYSFDFVAKDSYVIENVDLYPYQGVDYKENEISVKNSDIYSSSKKYPFNNVLVSERFKVRNMELVTVSVTPFSYNPQSKNLEVFTGIEIVVNESNSNTFREPINMKRSRVFEDLYSDMIVNFERSDRDEDYQKPAILYICGQDGNDNACDNNYVKSLFDWRHQQGYIVYEREESQIASTNTSLGNLKTYIQDALNWENPPEFVGLIGDTSGDFELPCNYHSWGGYSGSSDLYYTYANENNPLPGILIGRISAANNNDLNTIINKTIQYEKGINQTNNMFDSAALIADPNNSSGQSTIITNQYVENIMLNNGVEAIYTNYAQGNYINWLEDRLDDGVAFVNFRGWISGGISGIGENDMPVTYDTPFVTSLTCGTGDFGGGGYYGYGGESQSETFLRAGSQNSPRGAVAAVGVATQGTHTAYNNIMDMGMYDGIFSKGLQYTGAAVANGQLSIYGTYGSNSNGGFEAAKTFMAWTNLMGDPAIHLWTDTPKDFNVDIPSQISQGTTNLDLTINDTNNNIVDDAIVTLLQGNDDIFTTKLSDSSGKVSFNWSNINSSEDIIVTIRKRNYRPLQRTISVSSSNNLLSLNSSSVEVDISGNGQVNPGETIDIVLPIRNYNGSTASSVSATLSSISSSVDVVQSFSSYGNIGFNSSSDGEVFSISIAENVIDGQDLGLRLNINSSNNGDVICHVPISVSGALVVPQSSSVNLNSREINVSIVNDGSVSIEDVDLFISSNSDMISFNSAPQSVSGLNPNESVEISFTFNTTSYFVPGSTISLPLEITSNAGYNQTEFINATFGQGAVTDPLGPDEYGYRIYDSGDVGYLLAPDYDWIEIASSNNLLGLNDIGNGNGTDRTRKLTQLPFPITFYGITYNEMLVSADGWISFGDHGTFSGNDYIPSFRNYSIPGAGGPSPMVAAFWDDLMTESAGGWYGNSADYGNIYTFVDPDNEYFILQWDEMRTCGRIQGYAGDCDGSDGDDQTFQIIIYNSSSVPTITGDNEIKIQYQDFNNTSFGDYGAGETPSHGNYATIGIENHLGNEGIQYSYRNQYPRAAKSLSDGDAILITTGRASVNPGDVNQDGNVNISDIILTVNIILNIMEPTIVEALSADSNGDGELNILDVIITINIILDL